MSNPLLSLKKQKKPPLYLPEMPGAPTSSSSSFQNNSHGSILTPIDKILDSDNEISSRSPISSFNTNYSARNGPNSKKLNELPLSSRVPFKTSIDESDLIDEYTTKVAISNLKRNLPPAKPNHAPTDMDLMQIMMSKIKITEGKCAFMEKESKEKDKKISILEEKLEILKKANQKLQQNDLIKGLERKNLKLKTKIDEMEKFLADYGLKWVGDKQDESENISSDDDYDDNGNDDNGYVEDIENDANNTDSNLKFNYPNRYYQPTLQAASNYDSLECKFKCDYDKIVSNVKELNLLCEHNEPKIVNFKNGAKFESSNDSVNLTLYSNGILLFNGPFRSFDDSLTQKFCIDIMDGYFPSELEARYPDGVVFNLVDKRDVFYIQEKPNSVFKSKGYRLGSARLHSARNAKTKSDENQNIKTESSLKSTVTLEQFLNKLPNTIIKNGKVIDIKNDLKQQLDGHDDTATSNSQPRSVSIIDNTLNKQSQVNENVAALKVKSLANENINFMLKMNYTDTIQNLKDIIKSQRKLNGLDECDDFDLACMYPRRLLADLNLSLEQCELVPNSNILIMPRNK